MITFYTCKHVYTSMCPKKGEKRTLIKSNSAYQYYSRANNYEPTFYIPYGGEKSPEVTTGGIRPIFGTVVLLITQDAGKLYFHWYTAGENNMELKSRNAYPVPPNRTSKKFIEDTIITEAATLGLYPELAVQYDPRTKALKQIIPASNEAQVAA